MDINTEYFDLQNKFSKGEISLQEYGNACMAWNNKFSDILKAQTNTLKSNDPSRGGKLVKKEVTDKTGKKTTKWVKRNEAVDSKDNTTNSIDPISETDFSLEEWKIGAETASDESLNNTAKYAKLESIRKIARNELFKRSFQPKKFLDMSLMPDFMLDDYVNRYDNKNITKEENDAISIYRDTSYKIINDKLRNPFEEIDDKQKDIVKKIDTAISKSEMKNDVVLHRGISGNNASLFVNYLNSLDIGDVFEENSFSSTSLIEGQAIKFKDLYKSNNNIILKIYVSKGQNALSMQNLGSEDDKIMYKDEYEFLLPRKSKFQIIDKNNNEISVKLL